MADHPYTPAIRAVRGFPLPEGEFCLWTYVPKAECYEIVISETWQWHRLYFVGLTLALPQTAENDADMQAIVDALRRIAARQRSDEEAQCYK